MKLLVISGLFTAALGGGLAPDTVQDLFMPGTQPNELNTVIQDINKCSCHSGYDLAKEPMHLWQGSMMAQSMRDPVFLAALDAANRDFTGAGDLCLRCHTPSGWLEGRSSPVDGSALIAKDRNGVLCNFCHRRVDPLSAEGISIQDAHHPALPKVQTHGNGQYVIDPDDTRRGPYSDPSTPHAFLQYPWYANGDNCGTCHDVSNPVLFNPADRWNVQRMRIIERTFSEWKNSSHPASGRTCGTCHLPVSTGKACNRGSAPVRSYLPLHYMNGGNTWAPLAVINLNPGDADVNPAALTEGIARARALLQGAALLEARAAKNGGPVWLDVKVTNQSGHKLPTGYPEGRRLWLEVTARDAGGGTLFHSGGYDAPTATLALNPPPKIYEAVFGLSPAWVAQLQANCPGAPGSCAALSAGPSFHFVLNDTTTKDNRIPPEGFANAPFTAFQDAAADYFYRDGQSWDRTAFTLPPLTASVDVKLWYQSSSRDYIEYLRDNDAGSGRGLQLYQAWQATGMSAPELMASVAGVAAAASAELPVLESHRPDGAWVSLGLQSGGTYSFVPRDAPLLFFVAGDPANAENGNTLRVAPGPAGTLLLSW
jgi:hypothetical protein